MCYFSKTSMQYRRKQSCAVKKRVKASHRGITTPLCHFLLTSLLFVSTRLLFCLFSCLDFCLCLVETHTHILSLSLICLSFSSPLHTCSISDSLPPYLSISHTHTHVNIFCALYVWNDCLTLKSSFSLVLVTKRKSWHWNSGTYYNRFWKLSTKFWLKSFSTYTF